MIGLVCLLLAGSGGSGFFGNLTKGISSGISAVGSGVVSGTKAVGTGVVQGTKVSTSIIYVFYGHCYLKSSQFCTSTSLPQVFL